MPSRNNDRYYDSRSARHSSARAQYDERYAQRRDEYADYDEYSRYDGYDYSQEDDYTSRTASQRSSRGNYDYDYDERYYAPRARTERYRGMSGGYVQEASPARAGRRRDRYAAPVQNQSGSLRKKMLVVFVVIIVILLNFWLLSVSGVCSSPDEDDLPTHTSGSDSLSGSDAAMQETLEEKQLKLARSIVDGMTLEEKVGQLFLLRSNERSVSQFCEYIGSVKAGGVVLFKSDFSGKTKSEVIEMTDALQKATGQPLLICVDEEGGTVVRMSSNKNLRTEAYKSPQVIYKAGGMEAIEADTENKCAFLKTYGVNVNFAPVADVVTESSGFLYKRAFGKNADKTAAYVSTVVSKMKEGGVGSSIKHFPGYGNSKADTHEGLDVNTKGYSDLMSSDLLPFIAGIEAGADSIMVTHTIINCMDEDKPASLSEKVTAVIRDELDFDGCIITDALDMGAITEFCGKKDASVMAVQGGADLLCTPKDAAKSHAAIVSAVNEGSISAERIEESAVRIVLWKVRLGLYADMLSQSDSEVSVDG